MFGMHIALRSTPTAKNAYWRIFTALQSKYGNEGRFLEIGATDIKRTADLARRYGNLIGLDIDLEKLSQVGSIKRCNADACRLPFKDKTFTGIIAHHVIEHLPDDAGFIQELHRVLGDGGFVILGTPNRNRLASIIHGFFFGKRKFPWREHLREYDKDMLRQIVDDKLFSKIRIGGRFIGLHTSRLVVGFDTCPGILERWCNFWFIELVK
jgi:SAM-dependent methyltransferase